MASALKVLLAFLPKLCSSANNTASYIKRFARRLALFLAFLVPRFSVWLRSWHGELGTARQKSTPTEPPSPCCGASSSSRTVLHCSAGLGENLMACGTVPTLASGPSLQDPDRGTRQPATAAPSGGAILPPDGRISANLSTTNLSVHSSANDRHNIFTHTLESFHTSVDQPSQLEPGQGQDASQSRDRQFRSSSPTDTPYDRIIPASPSQRVLRPSHHG
ncbi:hypothetical protein BJV78DRAFT_239526 [Lactifluus subvellereus]|nr:hypothetical protein BJV78DRAFT_239526 [Lactifluus subvellereus]